MSSPEKSQDLPRLALIAGPTASGKSALAIELAERIGGVVVNADASQVYRDLRILSARPSPADEARVPHRLFGHVDGADSCSAARWAAEARAVIGEVHAAGQVPVLVGGTGLYLRTLLDGIAPVPAIDPAIREAVRALPVAQAHAALAVEDPAAAARLAPADTTRVARALEVVRSTGRPLAAWQAQREGGIGGAVDLRALAHLALEGRHRLLHRVAVLEPEARDRARDGLAQDHHEAHEAHQRLALQPQRRRHLLRRPRREEVVRRVMHGGDPRVARRRLYHRPFDRERRRGARGAGR